MENNLLKSRQHFEALDGLRGLAALSIVVFHLYEFLVPDYTKSPIGHGYLAVDFFFCLSGFVIGYAYDERAPKLGNRLFFLNRLIRLHPMVIWGSVIGLLGYLFDPFTGAANMAEAGAGKIVLAFVCSLVLLPFPWLPGRGGGLFPYNTPAWSLLMEYVINIVYALVLVRVSKRVLLVLLVGAAAWLIAVARLRGWIITGWDQSTFFDGFARVTFSFLAGLTVFRCNLIIKNRLNFLLLAALLTGMFVFPHFNNDWITEMVIVMVIFPLLLALGAGMQVTGFLEKCCVFTGRLSYPLYMTHIWAVWLFGNYLYIGKPTPVAANIAAVAVFFGTVLLGYLVLRFYDEPLRRWLSGRLQSSYRPKKETATVGV
ncbi:acyltransferase [Chitinophaga sp. Cy-1792]|uniref:acyltransferase family protein n=1 Tax=Chitinophaga sp. Cy-1792 TaxID=2608339 RepID=UPI0014226EE5|nr:acyltransferase [Chitinophaga sp. Cy-1792]NIG55771.1 acyltransferase [Chitinophaga sp. Cy-1792]